VDKILSAGPTVPKSGGRGGERLERGTPTRVFSEKRLQPIENKASGCGIIAKERSKRRQAPRKKGLGTSRLMGPVGYFMGYYTIWLVLVKRFFVPFWEFRRNDGISAELDNPVAGIKA
jgi:hypothetical protein